MKSPEIIRNQLNTAIEDLDKQNTLNQMDFAFASPSKRDQLQLSMNNNDNQIDYLKRQINLEDESLIKFYTLNQEREDLQYLLKNSNNNYKERRERIDQINNELKSLLNQS